MGLPIVALAKLSLLAKSHSTATPFIAGLICPFVVKLTIRLKLVSQAYTDLLYTSRLFFFQLGHIAFDTDQQALGNSSSTRWERARRLVYQSITGARRSTGATEFDEDSLHTLTLLSL
uniref:Uncharacterized protein n=1 Tax=Rhizophora mucronata TaxID=61149 RepID=A0A2P2QZD6_RHIMU